MGSYYCSRMEVRMTTCPLTRSTLGRDYGEKATHPDVVAVFSRHDCLTDFRRLGKVH